MTSRPGALSPPSLVLMTVYFNDAERDAAHGLGLDLYDALTRPIAYRLSFGAGIPVRCAVASQAVDLEAADEVVLIPVLGQLSFGMNRQSVLDKLSEWHGKLGAGHVLPLPVAAVWRNAEAALPGKLMLTELAHGGGEHARRSTLDEIVLAASRLLADEADTPQLFVSHAKADLDSTEKAAEGIARYAETSTTGKAFFDKPQLLSGESLDEQIDFAVTRGVFVAVRGDSYSSRTWCQKELLRAKQQGLPTVTVELLKKGELRSMAYGGNGPTIAWAEDPGEVTSKAMIEWLRAAHFRREAMRIQEAAELPDEMLVLIRPPELLDLAQGPLRSEDAQLIMYPDPELPVLERQILRAANPRLRFVTPLTAYRRVLERDGGSPGDAPLEGLQVAMSLSDSPDVNGPTGFTEHHVDDVTVKLARLLISAGASIAYGGDFRKNGYTVLLAELIQAYNQSAASPAEFLHGYLGAPISLGEAPEDLPMTLHHLVHSEDAAALAMLSPPSDQDVHPDALYYSDMRQVMVRMTGARVILGGGAEPRHGNRQGYGGRYPGVVEEAWRSLEKRQPLYVIGGFGGAAGLVAELLDDRPIPERLRDATWMKYEDFASRAEAIDADPFRKKLGLPQRMEDLAVAMKSAGLLLLESDEASLAWNGLTVEDNKRLFWSRDPVLITSLILGGLLRVNRRASSGKLAIELIHGSVTDAADLDAVAVGTFDGLPLGGAGAALDRLIGGLATAQRADGRSMVPVSGNSGLNASWIYLASLGRPGGVEAMEERIRKAAEQTALQAQRLGLRRLGVVAYGGNVISDLRTVAESMLDGLESLAGFASVSWFESDERRFDSLHEVLGSHENVKLTTRKMAAKRVQFESREEPLFLQVGYANECLSVTVLPPSGNAMASEQRRRLTEDELVQFAAGSGGNGRGTPDLETLASRGGALGKLLLGDQADDILARAAKSKVVVVHDVASSRLPFEILNSPLSGTPASNAGMNRRLAVPGVPVEQLFSRPPRVDGFHLLLVINPTKDLPGTVAEGDAVRDILSQQENIQLTILREDDATKEKFLSALAIADVLHYCGHAFFDGPGDTESGLLLAGKEKLTLADVRGVDMPRIAFVNACEAGRVRGPVTAAAASFAEFFLRGGIEAYLGTFWTVGDTAATVFAGDVYAQLAAQKTLDEAVTHARRTLKQEGLADWANYLLYGDGRFRLVLER